MGDLSVSTIELREGVNDPSPIRRVIAWDWHDGPVEGALQIGDGGPAFKFALLEETNGASDGDVRVYGLYSLPGDAFEQITTLLSSISAPTWPVWWPVWKFPDDATRQSVEIRLQEITDRVGPLTWVVVGDLANCPIRAMSVSALPAA